MDTIHRIILGQLWKAGGRLTPFHFYHRFNLSPGQISTAVRSLEKQGLATFDNNYFSITPEGQSFVLKSRMHLYGQPVRPWRQVPNEYKRPRLEANQPYLPRQSRLDRTFFKLPPWRPER